MRVILALLVLLTLTGCEAPSPFEISTRALFTYIHSELGIEREIPILGNEECLPESLRGRKHDDWPSPISAIPRSYTVVCDDSWPEVPELLAGDSGWTLEDKHRFGHFTDEFLEKYGSRLPIPKPGHWVITAVFYTEDIPLPYFAITLKNNFHFRIGAVRWDEVDHYWELWTIAWHVIDF